LSWRARSSAILEPGAGAADEFLVACGEIGRDYDRAWDLETVFSLLGNVDVLLTGNELGAGLSPDGIRSTLAAVVAAAVAA